jgi:hypothetical protein
MISPQEPSRGGMSNEEYARMMTGEKYWREHIAKEIDLLCTDECQIHPNIYFHNGHNAAADIARGKK